VPDYDGRWIPFAKKVKKLGIDHKSKVSSAVHDSAVLALPDFIVEEVARGIVIEAKLKTKDDIDLALKICVNLRKKYLKFSQILLEAMKTVFSHDGYQKVCLIFLSIEKKIFSKTYF